MSLDHLTALEAMQAQLRALEATVGDMRRDIRELNEDVALLTRLLRGDNGKESVLFRVAMIERILHDHMETAKQMTAQLASLKGEETKGRWSLMQAVTVALIAALGGVVSALATALLKGG